jgi:DNA-binding MarR family transcriptional regulator
MPALRWVILDYLVGAGADAQRGGRLRDVLVRVRGLRTFTARQGENVPKLEILSYIETKGEMTSGQLADAMGWTRSGAASTLLRFYRQGYLRRRLEPARFESWQFVYWLSDKGTRRLALG